jgi:hypothetical protein
MDPKEQTVRYHTFFDYWLDKLNEYLLAAKAEAFDLSARYQYAKFDRNRGLHFRNISNFDVLKFEKAALDLLGSKLEAENNVEWAEKMIADFRLLSESRVKVGYSLSNFIERNGIREKLGEAAIEDEFIVMWRAFNPNLSK